MEKGWDAAGRLQPLWWRVGGRDRLAELTDIGGTTLSGYNSGNRRLGMENARKIADALGVTIEDLGAPTLRRLSRREPDDDVSELRRELVRLREETERRFQENAEQQAETQRLLGEIRSLLEQRRSA